MIFATITTTPVIMTAATNGRISLWKSRGAQKKPEFCVSDQVAAILTVGNHTHPQTSSVVKNLKWLPPFVCYYRFYAYIFTVKDV